MKPYILGAIFARGGSKGIPGKNLRPLGGKPLLGHAIETALACKSLDRVIVSTDDEEIACVAREFGAEVPFMRPNELARDDSPEWPSWQHALRILAATEGTPHIDVLVSVPTTSPLRAVEDVEACIDTLLNSDADAVATATPARRSPHFNMVTLNGDGHARLVIPLSQPVSRRQAAPPVFDLTTVAYAARAEFVLRANGLFEGNLKTVIVPPERAVDIDTELDLQFAEFLLGQQRSRNG